MTSSEYKDLASSNGYKIEGKTDLELLSDYAFHKAACVGMDDEFFIGHVTPMQDPRTGAIIGIVKQVGMNTAARVRFNLALDCFDSGKTLEQAWLDVCKGNQKRSEIFEVDGSVKTSWNPPPPR